MSMFTTLNLTKTSPKVQMLDEVGRRQPFEHHAVSILFKESLAAVLCDLARDEDQVVFVTRDKIGNVTTENKVAVPNPKKKSSQKATQALKA